MFPPWTVYSILSFTRTVSTSQQCLAFVLSFSCICSFPDLKHFLVICSMEKLLNCEILHHLIFKRSSTKELEMLSQIYNRMRGCCDSSMCDSESSHTVSLEPLAYFPLGLLVLCSVLEAFRLELLLNASFFTCTLLVFSLGFSSVFSCLWLWRFSQSQRSCSSKCFWFE